jgi:subtilisin-like proprotein convertase family protein
MPLLERQRPAAVDFMKRLRFLIWLLPVLFCVIGLLYWHHTRSEGQGRRTTAAVSQSPAAKPAPSKQATTISASTAPLPLLGSPRSRTTNAVVALADAAREARLKYRLSNTTRSVNDLAHSDQAILLENALVDTARPVNFSVPDNLRADGDPGAYIVQARGPIDNSFRSMLNAAGVDIVSYIPNSAFLVRASANVAQQLAASPLTQTVLPYEPYYKVSPPLLDAVMNQQALPAAGMLAIVVFPGQEAAARDALKPLVTAVVSHDRSPFGPVLTVLPRPGSVPAIARLSVVESIGITSRRATANDLSRAFTGVATDSVTQSNYLNLSGSNVLVQVNDSGVDATHPDLLGRVFGTPLQDTVGHGTHVAGIIAGSGLESLTVTNAIGSIMPATNVQFRGKAPAASMFVQPLTSTDFELQEAAASTNAVISNNSWNYASQEYDIFAASYDAAVRDSLPFVTGSQPVLYVFSAGNAGAGDDNGLSGSADTIQSPATAKNVITVGALEQPRNITNNVVVDGQTNQPWAAMTDSSTEVASFSSRGNVGIGVEGDTGRFKPDVVAPGVFVVSTRSQQWDTNAYYNPTNYSFSTFDDQIEAQATNNYLVFIPDNAVQLSIFNFVIFPTNLVTALPIYLNPNLPVTAGDFLGIGSATVPPPLTFFASRGQLWWYGVSNPTNSPVQFELTTEVVTTNDNGDYFQVLQGMNDSLGSSGNNTYYRYESGTSMAAADVSGTLALIEGFFTNTLRTAPSPALLKAMLINGARSAPLYDLNVNSDINYQGWGVINLPDCLPSPLFLSNAVPAWHVLTNGPSPELAFDQGMLNAVATGDSQTLEVDLSTNAQLQPLRISVVWTDPPGNPMAGIKLVNNLGLTVVNLDNTNLVYFGNDFQPGNNFNLPFDTNSTPFVDVVNNVLNVYIPPNLGTRYSITVTGRRVNVNAVTANPSGVVQDFALVVSSGNGRIADALTGKVQSGTGGLTSANSPFVTQITNQFASIPGLSGQLLMGQHVGASSPLQGNNFIPLGNNTMWGPNGQIKLGVTNQWHFYVLTNPSTNNFTNAAFATFIPQNLAPSRMGATNLNSPEVPTNAVRPEADIDLYVSTDAGLTNLVPAVVQAASNSLTRGGTEVIVLTNAVPGTTYYVGVKSEDQEAAEYAFLGIFSQFAFSTMDNGVETIRGINVPQPIPDGSFSHPGVAQVIGIGVQPLTIRRVIVTNTITHQNFGDLLGNLSHNRQFVVLNNHNNVFGFGIPPTETAIFDDSGENNIPGSRPTDGPGSLINFMGEEAAGVWLLSEVDNTLSNTGRVDSLFIRVDPDTGGGGGTNTLVIQPNSFTYFSIDVPIQATNLVISFLNVSTTPLPLQVFMERGALPTLTTFDYSQTINPPGGVLAVSTTSLPPLLPGRYFVGIYNPNLVPQTVDVSWILFLNPNPISPLTFTSGGPTPILDDAVVYSTVTITNVPSTATIAQAAVGVAIDHPRVSDLVLTLIDPGGERFLLFENRGGSNTANIGSINITTNFFGTQQAGSTNAATNVISAIPSSGILLVNYDFYTEPDTIDVYYSGVDIFSPGYVSGSGQFFIPYGPGPATSITIVINQGNNTNNPTTQWIYTPAVVSQSFSYFTFTEDTNATQDPIKFAIPPLTGSTNLLSNDWSDGFENGAPNSYYSPSYFSGGWFLSAGNVDLLSNGFNGSTADTGVHYIDINGPTTPGTITTNVPTIPGQTYQLSFAWSRNPDSIAGGVIPLAGVYINTNLALQIAANLNNSWGALNWQHTSTLFVATSTLTQLQIQGLDPGSWGVLFDSFNVQLATPAGGRYLPEVPLQPLIGRDPRGTWTLEVQDDRVGAASGTPPPELISWQLQFVLATNVTTTVNLSNGVTSTNGIPACQFQYYTVQVPSWAAYVTNLLISATAPVNVWFNQTAPPTGTNTGDFELITNAASGSSTLFTNGAAPVFIPGTTYYLGVQNPCANGSNVTVQVQVDFGANVIRLSNMVPYANTNSGSNTLNDYYVFYVPTNAVRAQFEIDNPSGNMELVARKGVPPPDPFSFDYLSDNPGTNDELITVFTNSTPVPLSAGDWYLTAINLSGTQVNYSIMASWWPTTGQPINFTNTTISSNSFCITWTSLPFAHYFIQGATNLGQGMTWTTIVPDIIGASNATTTTYCIALPSPYHFFRVGDGLVPTFPTLPGGTAVTNTILPCQTSDYVVDVPPNASFAANTLVSATAPVNVWFNQTGRPGNGANPGDYELITNATSGRFTLTSSTVPPLVPGATYYLSIENPCINNTNVTVVVQVDFGQGVITLTNMIAYANVNGGTNANDYYVFNVPAGAARAQFEIDNPSAYVALLVSPGVPPDLLGYDYISANPGTNDQLIVVTTNSTPVPLAPGNWYLTAVNLSGGPASYSIMASWWPTTGQPINVTGTTFTPANFCITWDSVANAHYYIEGSSNLAGGLKWAVISPDIIGTGTNNTYCIPLPSAYRFFQVVEGIVPNLPPLAPTVTRVGGPGGGFQLQWSGPITAKYQVEWSPTLAPPVWTAFTNTITSNTGQFSFLDDGSQTGGFGATRFYRVIQLP